MLQGRAKLDPTATKSMKLYTHVHIAGSNNWGTKLRLVMGLNTH